MFKDLTTGFLCNAFALFRPKYLIWHALAIASTCLLVLSDSDWRFFLGTRPYTYAWLVFGAGLGGFICTLLVPLGIYLVGEYKKRRSLQLLGVAIAQGALIGYLVSVFYKVFTGRT